MIATFDIVKKAIIAVVTIVSLFSAGTSSKAEQLPDTFVQVHAEKKLVNVTAYVDNVAPSKNTIVNITVIGPSGAAVKMICHFQTSDASYTGVIGDNGKAVIPVQIGYAAPKYAVFVDVYVQVPGEKTYNTQTMFIPQ